MTDEPTLEIKARIDSLTASITEVTKGEHPVVIFSSLMSALANFLAHIENVDAALGDLQDGLPELESLTRRIRAKLDSGEEDELPYCDSCGLPGETGLEAVDVVVEHHITNRFRVPKTKTSPGNVFAWLATVPMTTPV